MVASPSPSRWMCSNKASLADAHAEVLKEFGPCDILVNGAGGNQGEATTGCEYHELDLDPDLRSFFGLSQEAVQGVFNLNFLGTFLPTQEFVKDMIGREGCCILNVSSMSSYHPLTKVLGYSAAKSAVNNLTEWLAVHFSHVGIRVNAIAPGFFATRAESKPAVRRQGQYTDRREDSSRDPMGSFAFPRICWDRPIPDRQRSLGILTGRSSRLEEFTPISVLDCTIPTHGHAGSSIPPRQSGPRSFGRCAGTPKDPHMQVSAREARPYPVLPLLEDHLGFPCRPVAPCSGGDDGR